MKASKENSLLLKLKDEEAAHLKEELERIKGDSEGRLEEREALRGLQAEITVLMEKLSEETEKFEQAKKQLEER